MAVQRMGGHMQGSKEVNLYDSIFLRSLVSSPHSLLSRWSSGFDLPSHVSYMVLPIYKVSVGFRARF